MTLRLTVLRDDTYDGRPIVVIGILVPPLVNPTVFQNDVVAAMLTALEVTSADVTVESVPEERPYFDLSNTKNCRSSS
jgi:hypothetical protein